MNLNALLPLKFNANLKSKLKNQTADTLENNTGSFFGVNSYPKFYYLNGISFGSNKLTAKELTVHIGEENFPCPEIFEELTKLGNSKDYSLYDIHLKHYKDLLDCSNLDEAKEKYPEFVDVIDAKDIDTAQFKNTDILKRIANGEIEGVNIENLSLELLKKQYGQLKSNKHSQNYFGLSYSVTEKLFKLLNIKKFNRAYYYNIVSSNPEYLLKISQASKKAWANDDGTRRENAREVAFNVLQSEEVRRNNYASTQTPEFSQKSSALMYKRWANDDGTMRQQAIEAGKALQQGEAKRKNIESLASKECRQKRSETLHKRWANDDGTMLEHAMEVAGTVLQSEEVRQKIKNKLNTPEVKIKKSNSMKKFHKDNPLYRKAQKLAWKRHPEITKVMSEIASHYPMLYEILQKRESGKELTKKEEVILRTYYKECEISMPDYKKIICEEHHNILVEWGLKENN